MINRRYEMGTYPIDYVGGECLTRGGNCGCDSCLAKGAGILDDIADGLIGFSSPL